MIGNLMEIYYSNNKLYKNNIFLRVSETKNKPKISLKNVPKNKIYSLVMFDPDAVGGNKIHWLITNIINENILCGNEIINYKGPAPPKGSGTHRYVFCLFEQKKIVSNQNVLFDSRFVELKILFKKIVPSMKFIDVIYFISENL